MHDEKLTLPKSLRRNEVEDLWKEKRKGYKMEIVNESLPELKNNSNMLDNIPESKSSVFSKAYKESVGTPFLQNRKLFKLIDYNDDRYKEKDYNIESKHETIFRRTNFRIQDKSESKEKRPPSASNRINSRNSNILLI
ncbi:unnamed protein product [Sphagnum balticum]